MSGGLNFDLRKIIMWFCFILAVIMFALSAVVAKGSLLFILFSISFLVAGIVLSLIGIIKNLLNTYEMYNYYIREKRYELYTQNSSFENEKELKEYKKTELQPYRKEILKEVLKIAGLVFICVFVILALVSAIVKG